MNSTRVRRNVRPTRPGTIKANKRAAKNNVQQDVVAMMAPVKTQVPIEPPEADNTVITTQMFRVRHNIPMGTGMAPVSVADIMSGVPGSTTFWQGVRFEKFMVYGGDSLGTPGGSIPIQVNVGSLPGGFLSIRDEGTTGATRPSVGFRLGLVDRATWYGPADVSPLFSVNQTSSLRPIVVYATVALRSPAPVITI